MSSYELVSPEDYEALPADHEECFVALETICHRNMMAIIHEDTTNEFDTAVRMEYVAIITAFAQECGITEVVAAYGPAGSYEDFSRFLLVVRGAVAEIRFRNRGVARSTTVLLLANTKTKIEHYISRLEHAIATSDLPDNRKKALAQKIQDFRAELVQPRLGRFCCIGTPLGRQKAEKPEGIPCRTSKAAGFPFLSSWFASAGIANMASATATLRK